MVHRTFDTAIRRTRAIELLRIAFGLIWSVDATLKWLPAFRSNFGAIVSGASQGQPGFLQGWFALWRLIVSGQAPLLAVFAALTETYLALALITGFARRFTYGVGIVYGLLVWSVAEGFGGPYVAGMTTDVGAAIIYSLVFWALMLLDVNPGRMNVDRVIARRIPLWRRIAG